MLNCPFLNSSSRLNNKRYNVRVKLHLDKDIHETFLSRLGHNAHCSRDSHWNVKLSARVFIK